MADDAAHATGVEEWAAAASATFAAARESARRDPAAAGALVHRLFYTPELQRFRHRTDDTHGERVRQFLSSASRSRVPRPRGGLAYYEWPGTGGARVLLVHGWTSQAADWLLPARALAQAGATVAAYDHPAHGASDGTVTSLPDCVDAFNRVLAQTGPYDAVFAHSGGGAIVATALGGAIEPAPRPPARLALLAPPASLRATMVRFAERYGLLGPAFAGFEAAIEAENGRPVDDFEVAGMLSRVDVPTMHVVATRDEEIPAIESVELRRALPAACPVDVATDHAGLLASRAVARELVGLALGHR